MLKKVLNLSLAILLVLGLLPSAMLTVSAAQTIIVDLADAPITVAGNGGVTANGVSKGTLNFANGDILEITGTSTLSTTPASSSVVAINSDTSASITCNVKLSGVSIIPGSSIYPIKLSSASGKTTTVNLMLNGASTITEGSGYYKPGIYVTEWATLNISSFNNNNTTDTLSATASSGSSAAIGGQYSANCGTINISGGTVTASTNNGTGAAIGGGCPSAAGTSVKPGTINISGGIVNATSGIGAAIGSGANNGQTPTTAAVVNISGGVVTATTGVSGNAKGGAAIGSGGDNNTTTTTANAATVTITGGTITAKRNEDTTNVYAIGRGNPTTGSTGTVYIKNASVLCKNKSNASVALSSVLNDSTNLTPVYLTTVTVASASASTALNVNSASFTVNSDASSKVYLYLPTGTYSNSTATIGGTQYSQQNSATVDNTGNSTMSIAYIPPVSSVDIDISTGNIIVNNTGVITGAVSGKTLTSGGTINVTQSNNSTPTANYIQINSFNCTIKLNGVNMVLTTASPVQILGTSNVNVQLQGANTLTGGNGTSSGQFAALNVASGATVAISSYDGIDADGSLTATGGRGSAAIGGTRANNCGTITINSGTINASVVSNDLSSAAIGGAYGAATALTCGTITINGGIITANAMGAGPGIGSGITNGCTSSTNVTIDITGGTITAAGGAMNGGSAIGAGGGDYDTQAHNATVTITGGTIKATVYTVQATPIGKGTTNGTGTVYIKGAYVSTSSPLTGVLTQAGGTAANLTIIALPTATGSNNYLKAFELTFGAGTKLPINMSSDASSNIYIYLPSAKTSCSAKNITTGNTYTAALYGSNNAQVSRITTGTFGNGNTITAYVGLSNNTASSYDAVVYIAYYDSSNKLISLATPATSTLTANGGTGALNPSIALPSSGTTGGKVRIFIWNFNNLAPLMDAALIQ